MFFPGAWVIGAVFITAIAVAFTIAVSVFGGLVSYTVSNYLVKNSKRFKIFATGRKGVTLKWWHSTKIWALAGCAVTALLTIYTLLGPYLMVISRMKG